MHKILSAQDHHNDPRKTDSSFLHESQQKQRDKNLRNSTRGKIGWSNAMDQTSTGESFIKYGEAANTQPGTNPLNSVQFSVTMNQDQLNH